VFTIVGGIKVNFLEQLVEFRNLENKETEASKLIVCLLLFVFIFLFGLSGISLLAGMDNF
jgi:hypothetical protein